MTYWMQHKGQPQKAGPVSAVGAGHSKISLVLVWKINWKESLCSGVIPCYP